MSFLSSFLLIAELQRKHRVKDVVFLKKNNQPIY